MFRTFDPSNYPLESNVFVYGSLMKGFGNNRLLRGADYLGTATTGPGLYRLVSLGAFPGAVMDPTGKPIRGELYVAGKEEMAALDTLESEGSFYKRVPVRLTVESPARPTLHAGETVFAQFYMLMAEHYRTEQEFYPTVTARDGAYDWRAHHTREEARFLEEYDLV